MNGVLSEIDLLGLLDGTKMRPTRQRKALAAMLFKAGHRHVTAEELHREACADGIRVALATVYNTLHLFTRAGLLREVTVGSGQRYFDTNVSHHHHILNEQTGQLSDIDEGEISISGLPKASEGMEIRCVDVVVRVRLADKEKL